MFTGELDRKTGTSRLSETGLETVELVLPLANLFLCLNIVVLGIGAEESLRYFLYCVLGLEGVHPYPL